MRSIVWALCCVCAIAAGGCGDDDSDGGAGKGGSGGRSGSGGATSGAGGAGRSASGSGGSGGAPDSGTTDQGGRGGAGGRAGTGGAGAGGAGGADEDDAGVAGTSGGGAGGAGAGGAAGGGGSGGAAGSGADTSATQCVDDAMAAGQTITDCERCLCAAANCQAQMNAIKSDSNANALVTCSKQNVCSGQCCLCSTNGHGDTCGVANYGTGDCAPEVETAAGATPGAGLANAGTVTTNCTADGPNANNSCTRVQSLSDCAADKCAAECPSVVVPCP